jgi:hypothetical protein
MNRNFIVLIIVIVGLVATLVGAYFYSSQFTRIAPPLTNKSGVEISPQAQLNETGSWKVYRNEDYGIVFKYPDNLIVLESYSSYTGEYDIVFAPTKHQTGKDTTGKDFVINPKITLSHACLIPKSTSEKSWEIWESWENNFQQPLTFDDPFYDITSGGFLETYSIGARKLFVFNQGCYECYDGLSGPDPNTEYNGFAAYSCEAGLNKNGNKAADCLALITERQKIGSSELEKLKKLFLDDFIPTIEFQQSLMIQDCEGLGESVG